MPSIPVIEQQTRLGDVSVPYSGGRAEGLTALGHAITGIGDELQRGQMIDREIQVRNGQRDAETALSDLDKRTAQNFQAARLGIQGDGQGFAGQFSKQFAETTSDIASGLSPLAAQIFKARARSMGATVFKSALNVEAGAAVAYDSVQASQALNNYNEAVRAAPDRYWDNRQSLQDMIGRLRLTPELRAEMLSHADTLLGESAATGIADHDGGRALQLLQQGGKSGDARFDSLSPEGVERVTRVAKAGIVRDRAGAIIADYQNGTPDVGSAMLAHLAQSGLPQDVQDEIRGKVNAGVAQLRTQRQEEHAQDFVTLQRSLASGTAGNGTRALVDTLYSRGALTPLERATYQGQIDRAILERKVQTSDADVLRGALANGLPLDPQNAQHRKALAAAFGQDTAAVPVGSQTWQSTAIAYADRMRMLPDQVTSWARQSMRSPDANVAAAGAQFLGAVHIAAPDAVSGFDADTRTFAGMVNSMIESGTPAPRAVEVARANVFELKPEIAEQRKQEFTKTTKDNDAGLGKHIGQDMGGGWFHADPAPSASLAADYKAQAARYYQRTGDLQMAGNLAWQDLQRVYGVTHVNGSPQVIAFPPERYGLKPEEIRSELGEFLKANPQADGSKAEEIILVPDGLTLRDAGDALTGEAIRPSYKLVTKTGDLVLDAHGIPKRYTVPTGDELTSRLDAGREAAARAGHAEIQAARDLRARRDAKVQQLLEQARTGTIPVRE